MADLVIYTSPAIGSYKIWVYRWWYNSTTGLCEWRATICGTTRTDLKPWDYTSLTLGAYYKVIGIEQTVGGKTYFYVESAWWKHASGHTETVTLTLIEKIGGNQPPLIPTPENPPWVGPVFNWGAIVKDINTNAPILGASVTLHTPEGDQTLLTDIDGYAGDWKIKWGAGIYEWTVSALYYFTEDFSTNISASGNLYAALTAIGEVPPPPPPEWTEVENYLGYHIEQSSITGRFRWPVQFYYLECGSLDEAHASIERWRIFVGTEAEFLALEAARKICPICGLTFSTQEELDTHIAAMHPGTELVATLTAAPTNGVVPLAVTFTIGIAGGFTPYTWTFDYGDATTPGSGTTPGTMVHTYTTVGNYTAALTVTDALGASVLSRSVTYAGVLPIPDIVSIILGLAPLIAIASIVGVQELERAHVFG